MVVSVVEELDRLRMRGSRAEIAADLEISDEFDTSVATAADDGSGVAADDVEMLGSFAADGEVDDDWPRSRPRTSCGLLPELQHYYHNLCKHSCRQFVVNRRTSRLVTSSTCKLIHYCAPQNYINVAVVAAQPILVTALAGSLFDRQLP